MNIINRLKYWYTRPRSGKMFGFASWIMTDPKAFSIVLIMGYVVAVALFGGIASLAWFFSWNWIAKGIFTFGFLLSSRNLYRFYITHRKTGSAIDMTMSDFLGKGKK